MSRSVLVVVLFCFSLGFVFPVWWSVNDVAAVRIQRYASSFAKMREQQVKVRCQNLYSGQCSLYRRCLIHMQIYRATTEISCGYFISLKCEINRLKVQQTVLKIFQHWIRSSPSIHTYTNVLWCSIWNRLVHVCLVHTVQLHTHKKQIAKSWWLLTM